MHDELCGYADDSVAELKQPLVAASIGAAALCMVVPIDFDDEAQSGGEEVYDVAIDRYLPAELDAETAPADGFPQTRFRGSGSEAHATRAGLKQLFAFDV